MIKNNLIKNCICGNTDIFEQKNINSIDTNTCGICNIIHANLPDWTEEKYYEFYEKEYHKLFQERRNTMTYEQRYSHDCSVSRLRLEQYKNYITEGMVGLDIGSSNSAFVHEANRAGMKMVGLEPGKNIGDDLVTIRGTLQNSKLDNNTYDFITMHDSVEHMIDVKDSLMKVFNLLKSNGVAIIDLPDFFVIEGKHHWKYIEHLWYFKKEQFINVLSDIGFTVEEIVSPIPGKLVFYARKNK